MELRHQRHFIEADHVAAARYGKRAVERDQATAMSARQAEEILIRNLPPLFARAGGEAVNVFDRERGCPGAPRKDRHAALEAHVRICYPPKQGFDELVNALAGPGREIGESFLQRGVYADRGVRHTSFILPRCRRKQEDFASYCGRPPLFAAGRSQDGLREIDAPATRSRIGLLDAAPARLGWRGWNGHPVPTIARSDARIQAGILVSIAAEYAGRGTY